MRKRVLSFLLAASAAFCFIRSSAPEAHAIVPIGLVQSALASYVTSAGYKMWSENGGGDLMVKAISTLYQSWLDSTDPVGALTLGQMSENDYVYLDTSGQIVIRKAAADLFQQFSDWIQTEYSVPVGSDTPTEVVPASGGGDFTMPNGATGIVSYPGSDTVSTPFGLCPVGRQIGIYQSQYPVYMWSRYSSPTYLCRVNLKLYFTNNTSGYVGSCIYRNGSYENYGIMTEVQSGDWKSMNLDDNAVNSQINFSIIPLSSYAPDGSDVSVSGGVAGLGVTLAQAVADVVGQAKEDDAVVIGVGASAGATAQDIADMVAQGVKAQTLDPSVSITAEAVIDTPVQPYPDIDGLGLPTLGAALVDRFPFCIPWDFVDTVKLLSADPQPINIKVDLIPQRIKTSVGITSDTSFDIDLSGEQYAKIGVFCRWGSLITFCFGLFLLTKRLVWTA